ncbi:MAG: hypothetical protein HYX89_03665 [Chloroflexi bacterium]|nr:hypothetical protein [Chloroflexota bacterium]
MISKGSFVTRKTLISLATLVALLGVVAVAGSALGQTSPDLQAAMTGTIQGGGRTIAYNVTLSSTTGVGDVFVAASIPSGAAFSKVGTLPKGVGFKGVEGGNAIFLISEVPAKTKVTIPYEVSVTHAPAGPASAWARALKPGEVTAASSDVNWQAAVAAGAPRRGCTACHVLADPATGKYSLYYEAIERAEVREALTGGDGGPAHPTMDRLGNPLTFETGVETCLQCHAPGTGAREGRGVAAPRSLRDIVHPAHMNSTAFITNYGGNCFTCHNVGSDGAFELLSRKVETNEKGVPEVRPIPGALRPSETW